MCCGVRVFLQQLFVAVSSKVTRERKGKTIIEISTAAATEGSSRRFDRGVNTLTHVVVVRSRRVRWSEGDEPSGRPTVRCSAARVPCCRLRRNRRPRRPKTIPRNRPTRRTTGTRNARRPPPLRSTVAVFGCRRLAADTGRFRPNADGRGVRGVPLPRRRRRRRPPAPRTGYRPRSPYP